MGVEAKKAMELINQNKGWLVDLSRKIWEAAEMPLHEYKSAEYLVEALREHDFSVETGVAGMPTAFVGTWGEDKPVIGILGEYDALGGVSQKAVPYREELVPGAGGHACGHNLLGTGALAGALGLKAEMEARGLPGTVKYFGCPAEENLSGKAFMAREGLFDDLDACLTWHPGALNRVWGGSSLANNAMNIAFKGRTAHAAGDPHNGRSALDAVQLMNLGVEFLREHMPQEARVHYAITRGGDQPNVVPAHAQVWYLVRGPERHQVDELYERVLNCARGAATMTDTEYEVELLKAIYNLLPNDTLEGVLLDSMKGVGAPKFGEKEQEFARELAKTLSDKQRESALDREGLGDEEKKALEGKLLSDVVSSPDRARIGGSTDVGDVSWCCPTAQFRAACNTIGTPGHSWQYVAQAGMEIGERGMIQAGKILAEAGLKIMTDADLRERARQEFEERTGGRPYQSAMPPEQKPAFHQFADSKE